MLIYPHINPVALQIGWFKIHWYGLMYLVGFLAAWRLALWRAKTQTNWTKKSIDDLFFYCALGVILGGRVGYLLFYQWSSFLQDPWRLFRTWEGGMSFHGGLLGVIIAMGLFGYRYRMNFLKIADFVAPLVPIGLATGRFGNFINGEVWGRITDVPWAMIFPLAGPLPRHPSQLYECLGEGVFLFILLWCYSAKPRPRGSIAGLFLLVYAIVRFGLEFLREPDRHLGFIAFGWLSMGQLLCLPMLIVGVSLIVCAYRHGK